MDGFESVFVPRRARNGSGLPPNAASNLRMASSSQVCSPVVLCVWSPQCSQDLPPSSSLYVQVWGLIVSRSGAIRISPSYPLDHIPL